MDLSAPPFISRRSPVLARHGMVACTQPLAAQAGMSILQAGGNAADAAVAIAAAMQLCEPCSTGLGGDAFALYYDAASRTVSGLNASGRAPAELTLELARSATPPGATPAGLPLRHAYCVTVPGAASGWAETVRRWGRLPLARVLEPATTLAREGFPVSPLTAHYWQEGVKVLRHHGAASHAHELLVMPEGRAPLAGEVFRNPALADVLDRLARDGADAGFYRGRTGEAIVAAVRAAGGVLSAEDLASHTCTFIAEPISTVFAGVRVWEIPPNGQGLTALLALNNLTALHTAGPAAALLEPPLEGLTVAVQAATASTTVASDQCSVCRRHFDSHDIERHRTACIDAAVASPAGVAAPATRGLSSGPAYIAAGPAYTSACAAATAGGGHGRLAALGHNSAAYLHAVIECTRLAFADSRWHVADPATDPAPLAALLSPGFARSRVEGLAPGRALADVARGSPAAGSDTVSFQVVDGDGNACSFINSNYAGFGTGIVPAGCGFSLQNRGANFSLDAGHPNALVPRKRPYHTIIPGMATHADDGALFASFSVMGGFMQPQGHVQVLLNLLEAGCDPQTALDQPRFCIDVADASGGGDGGVLLEDGIPEAVAQALRGMGHRVTRTGVAGHGRAAFGRGQVICRDRATGVLWGGSDGRGDGCALGW